MQYAIALAAIPNYTRLIAFEETKMSVLLGFNPRNILTGIGLENQQIPNTIPAGLPSSLLLRRPDIGYSEAKYHAQMAKIGVAQKYRIYFGGKSYEYNYTFNTDNIVIDDFEVPGDLCNRLF